MRVANGRRAVIAAVLAIACSLGSATVAGAAGVAPVPVPTSEPAAERVAQYEVSGDRSPEAIARMIEAGVSIDRVAESSVIVSADPAQAAELARRGFDVSAPLPGPTTDASADRPIGPMMRRKGQMYPSPVIFRRAIPDTTISPR